MDESKCASGFTAIWDLCCLKGVEGCSYSCIPSNRFEQVTSAPLSRDDVIAMIKYCIATSAFVLSSLVGVVILYIASLAYGVCYLKKRV